MLDERLKLKPCTIGSESLCCKTCMMGPCRLVSSKTMGVCGATRNLVIARNLLRFVTGGTASHLGHATHLLRYLSNLWRKRPPRNYIRNRAPKYLYQKWRELGLLPREEDGGLGELAEALHMTTMGVNSDYKDVLLNCLRIGIVDGFFGLYLSTELEDREFGPPVLRDSVLDLGCIEPEKTHIAIHGHEPELAHSLVEEAAKHPDVQLIGVCCTGSSLLAKAGVPMAAHFSMQEDVVATGLIEALVVDAQCIMPSISDLCDCFHTVLISTNAIARLPTAVHKPVTSPASAKQVAREVIEVARENRARRKAEREAAFAASPRQARKATVGHSERSIPIETICACLQSGELKGVIAVVGCANPRGDVQAWKKAFVELSQDYLILTTGCMAFEFGREGLLDGRRFLHLGSCVNNSRVAKVLAAIAERMGKRTFDLPFLVSAPLPIAEKAMSIALFFAAFGCSVHSGYPYALCGSSDIAGFLGETLASTFGTTALLEDNPTVFLEKAKATLRQSRFSAGGGSR